MLKSFEDFRKEVMREAERLDAVLAKKYLGIENKSFSPDELNYANIILQNDIERILKRAEDIDETRDEIVEILKESERYDSIEKHVDMEKTYKAASIRRDFPAAFRGVRHGRDLSMPLGWGFTKEDIESLAKLHKSNRFRKKIEDLLEDCNFHEECGMMASGDYSKWFGDEAVCEKVERKIKVLKKLRDEAKKDWETLNDEEACGQFNAYNHAIEIFSEII